MTIKKHPPNFFYNTGNTKFEGHIDTLKTFVYDFVGIRQSELNVQTTKEIGDYVSKTLKNLEMMPVRQFNFLSNLLFQNQEQNLF